MLRALRESNANNCAIFAFYIVNLRADLTSVFFSDVVRAVWGPALATHEQFRPDFVSIDTLLLAAQHQPRNRTRRVTS